MNHFKALIGKGYFWLLLSLGFFDDIFPDWDKLSFNFVMPDVYDFVSNIIFTFILASFFYVLGLLFEILKKKIIKKVK